MKVVEIAEAAGRLDELVAEAEHGEEVVLARNGVHVARIARDRPHIAAMIDRLHAMREEMRAEGVRPFTTEEIVDLIREGRGG